MVHVHSKAGRLLLFLFLCDLFFFFFLFLAARISVTGARLRIPGRAIKRRPGGVLRSRPGVGALGCGHRTCLPSGGDVGVESSAHSPAKRYKKSQDEIQFCLYQITVF